MSGEFDMSAFAGLMRETPQEYRDRKARNILVRELRLKPVEIELLKDRLRRRYGRGYIPGEHDVLLLYQEDNRDLMQQRKREQERQDYLKSPKGQAEAREEAERLQRIRSQPKEQRERALMGEEDRRSAMVEKPFRHQQQQTRVEMGAEDVKSQRLREHTQETERLMLLRREREMAMLLPTIEEPVIIDRSDQIRMNLVRGGHYGNMEGYGTTGVGFHINIGQRHSRAKLNDLSAQQIRIRYWAIPEEERPSYNAFAVSIADLYNVKPTTITSLITRKSWTGLLYPAVEGEPQEVLSTLNSTEAKVLTDARKAGLLTAVGKGQRQRLTDEQIAEQREEVARLLREKEDEKGRKKREKDEAKRVKKEADDLKKAQEKVRKKLEREAKKKEKSK
jgi:hypothetical protein